MKKIVLIFGLVIGTILSCNSIIMINQMYSNPDFKGNDVVGYAALVVLFSLIFFGVRNYRNKHLNGFISFGNAFKTGTLIALVGSTMYVVVGLAYYYLFVPDFIDVYIAYVLDNCNCSPAELQAKTIEMANFKELYKNPLFAIFITYMEVFPIGLVVALISALLIRKKQPDNQLTL
jgi:hypothetical protein